MSRGTEMDWQKSAEAIVVRGTIERRAEQEEQTRTDGFDD